MKIALVIHAPQAHKNESETFDYCLAHTGQQNDAQITGAFFCQLSNPKSNVNLDASIQIVTTLAQLLVPTSMIG